jgi:hypothetical protein
MRARPTSLIRSGATSWTQQAYLKPAAVGTAQVRDQFGWSVAVSGDTVAVGAYQEASSTTGVNSAPNESAGNSGAAYVFTGLGHSFTTPQACGNNTLAPPATAAMRRQLRLRWRWGS